jgi:membrane-associated protease RseP (regulator of RpoE activity)
MNIDRDFVSGIPSFVRATPESERTLPDQATPPRNTNQNIPPLRREVVVRPADQGYLALVFALCTMAGLSVGFGLKAMTLAMMHDAQQVSHARGIDTPVPQCDDECAWLGIQFRDAGAYPRVVAVFDKSPAARAGIKVGDRIARLDGTAIRTSRDIIRKVRSKSPGDTLNLSILRRQLSKSKCGKRAAKKRLRVKTNLNVMARLGSISGPELEKLASK